MGLAKTAAAFALLAAAFGLDLQKGHHHHRHGHHHKHAKKTALLASSEVESDVSAKILSASLENAKKIESRQAAALNLIDTDIAESWKQKAYLTELQRTMDAEEALLKQQQALKEASTSSTASDAAEAEVKRTKDMIEETRGLMTSSRQSAMQKASKAIADAKSVAEAAAKEEKLNADAVEEAQKLKDSAQQMMARAQSIQDKAAEQQRYFRSAEGKTVLDQTAAQGKPIALDQITAQVVESL